MIWNTPTQKWQGTGRLKIPEKEEIRIMERILKSNLAELEENLNLRLLLESDLDTVSEGGVLWVESISLTGLEYPAPRREGFFFRLFKKLGSVFRGIFRHVPGQP